MLPDINKIIVDWFCHLLVVNGQLPCQEVGVEDMILSKEHKLLPQET